MKIAIQADQSEARYKAQEVLVRVRAPSQAVGKTKAITGDIVLDSSGKIVPDQSTITVDLRQVASDERQRDQFIRSDTLQTNQFPNAVFKPTKIDGIPWPAPATGSFNFTLDGDMTIHGVTKPVTWTGSGEISGNQVTASATLPTKITTFGMTLPRVPVLLSIEDDITLELDLKGTTSPA